MHDDKDASLQLTDMEVYNEELYNKLISNEFNISEEKLIQIIRFDTLSNETMRVLYVPFKLRKKIMDYAHHNPYLQHFGGQQTFNNLELRYWWEGILKDCSKFVDNCIVCQTIKGSIRKRAPLIIRKLPKPRVHIMADFIGAIFKIYYILVIIDYSTGYVMMRGFRGCSIKSIIQMLFDHWIPVMGWFEVFESDYGSAFNNEIFKRLNKVLQVKQHFSEPHNHQGTGKVEAAIKMIQQILNAFNVESGNQLIDPNYEILAWRKIKLLLPFIQYSMNQKKSRFTDISPNMLMFGSQLNDIQDIGLKLKELDEEFNDDDEIVNKLITKLKYIQNKFSNDWNKYMKITKDTYSYKFDINRKIIESMKKFKPGIDVMYFIKNKSLTNYKWRQKWSGPWKILKRLDDRTLIITDKEDDISRRVSIDRCKIYNKDEYYTMQEYKELMKKKLNLSKHA